MKKILCAAALIFPVMLISCASRSAVAPGPVSGKSSVLAVDINLNTSLFGFSSASELETVYAVRLDGDS
ncbi:MAG: hypothetical protein ACRCUT_10575, partial [Spirochaetota bacterium]